MAYAMALTCPICRTQHNDENRYGGTCSNLCEDILADMDASSSCDSCGQPNYPCNCEISDYARGTCG
jgi:hypothetical protein